MDWEGRVVLETGHTGFKGSWLTLWVSLLGARVTGISFGYPTFPSHFKVIKIAKRNHIKVLEKAFTVKSLIWNPIPLVKIVKRPHGLFS